LTATKKITLQVNSWHINHTLPIILAGNQPIEVKSGPFEVKGGAMKLSVEARTFPSPTQPVQNSLTPTNLASTPMTNNAGGFAAQPEPKGDDQYVVLNVLNALPAPPPPKVNF
jgi:hypothetical protein